MLLGAKALLDRERYPDLEQTRDLLSAVICRCTGYTKPVEAVLRRPLTCAGSCSSGG